MTLIKMKTSYRHFYNPGDVVEEDPAKAKALVDRGSAEYVKVEEQAPANKEVQTSRKAGEICDICGKGFTARGLKLHKTRIHG